MSTGHPDDTEVPTNKVGASTVEELIAVERLLAANRIRELDSDTYLERDDYDPSLNPAVLTTLEERRFDADYLRAIHAYILQDVYDWGGRLREPGETTMAMGIDHAPPEAMREVLPHLEADIALDRPDIDTDKREALETAADHWSQMTYLHPFPDGNSRSQRVFFTEYLRDAGWDLDWNKIDAGAVHAARHVSLLFQDPTYLAAQLEPGYVPFGDADAVGSLGTLSQVEYNHDPETIRETYVQMITYADQAQDDPTKNGYTFAAERARIAANKTMPTAYRSAPTSELSPAERAARLASRGTSRANPAQPTSQRPSVGPAARRPTSNRTNVQHPER